MIQTIGVANKEEARLFVIVAKAQGAEIVEVQDKFVTVRLP